MSIQRVSRYDWRLGTWAECPTCCPGTGRLAAKLLLPLGGLRFLGREAYGLGYACQRETRSSRVMHKARKLHRALGGDGIALGPGSSGQAKGDATGGLTSGSLRRGRLPRREPMKLGSCRGAATREVRFALLNRQA